MRYSSGMSGGTGGKQKALADRAPKSRRASEKKHGASVDHVFEIVRQAIISGRFVPGQRLILRDLQEEYGFSRSTFREAFRRLASERLVSLVPNRGVAVERLSRQELIDLFQIRETLEGLAARLAAERIGDGNNRKIFTDACKQIRADKRPERTAYIEHNHAFHEAIVAVAGNTRLRDLLLQMRIPILMSLWRQVMTPSDIENSLEEHETIIKAILNGEPGKADAAMQRHLHRAAKRTLASFEPH
jgi:DNA-binding GntR family transcriptional regulator